METTDPTAPERSASLTLDQIREGGQSLVLLCQTRLADLSEAIREGRFHDAMGHLSEIGAKLTALAQAENALGSLAEAIIIRAEEVEVGMTVRGYGTVTDVRREEKPVAGDDPCVHLHFTFEGEMPELEIHAEHEIVVMRSEG